MLFKHFDKKAVYISDIGLLPQDTTNKKARPEILSGRALLTQ